MASVFRLDDPWFSAPGARAEGVCVGLVAAAPVALELAEDVALAGGIVTRRWTGMPAREWDGDVVVVDARDGTALRDLGEWNPASDRPALLILTEMEWLDLAWAVGGREDDIIVVGSCRAERLAALCRLMGGRYSGRRLHGGPAARVREDAEPRTDELHEIADAVAQLAVRLARISGHSSNLTEAPVWPVADRPGGPVAEPAIAFHGEGSTDERVLVRARVAEARLVRAIIKARRLRGRFMDDAMFADPAWDMLLDLTAARLEGKPVAVSSLCIAAAVPPTTALRWIKLMTDKALFVRRADDDDGRRIFVEIADGPFAAMTAYLEELRAQQLMPC